MHVCAERGGGNMNEQGRRRVEGISLNSPNLKLSPGRKARNGAVVGLCESGLKRVDGFICLGESRREKCVARIAEIRGWRDFVLEMDPNFLIINRSSSRSNIIFQGLSYTRKKQKLEISSRILSIRSLRERKRLMVDWRRCSLETRRVWSPVAAILTVLP